ncbi:hypothetical protein ABEB36_000078 [Hypothenemus hampei]|uniref:Uncharacterized protein n=1 Tax=Hypothenemus hampei TaxID=57062 RepID=A0ABD1FCT2_HYPHA
MVRRSNLSRSSENVFNIKKAKQEVFKLGISGFDPIKKEDAKIQQLIKLGAKPPKRKGMNYKDFQIENKKKKNIISDRQKNQQIGKNSIGKSIAKGKSFDRKRRKEGILDIYGKLVHKNKKQLKQKK